MRRNVRVVSSLIAIIVAAALASAVTAASAQPPKTKSEDLLHQRATVNAAKISRVPFQRQAPTAPPQSAPILSPPPTQNYPQQGHQLPPGLVLHLPAACPRGTHAENGLQGALHGCVPNS